MMSRSVNAPSEIGRCRDCGATVRWGETASGRRAPYDSDGQLHFRSCQNAQPRQNGASRSIAQPAPAVAPDSIVLRVAALQAAAAYLGPAATVREEVRANDVLRVADLFLDWLTKGGDAAD